MSILRRLFRDDAGRDAMRPLYDAVVAAARAAVWYRDGQVPDTVDGRFDMIAAILSLVLIRLEAEGEPARAPAALLTEQFIADMDGQLREFGVGDVIVGKHVGKLMGALGGRLDAYRGGLAGAGLADAVARNIFRDAAPDGAAARVADRLHRYAGAIGALPAPAILAGKLPTP